MVASGSSCIRREPTPIDNQTVIRMNRDTLYSAAVFDLDAGPVTITLPDAGKRFMSLQVINEDQYTPGVFYGAGRHTLKREEIGTRYVVCAIRTLVDPTDPKDLERVHALQDAIKVEQASPGKFEVPNWDPASQKKVREALLVLGATLPDSKRMFGTKDQVDPVRFLIGSAMAWGGNPEKDATYLNVTPRRTTARPSTAHREGRAGRWLLVDQRLQREGLFREERSERLFGQQPHREEGCGWVRHRAVRRLRRQSPELSADHAGLELHRAALSSAEGDHRRHLEIPGGEAVGMTGVAGVGAPARSTRAQGPPPLVSQP